MTTYRCASCSTILEVEKLPLGNIVEVKPCEPCIEAAVEAALDAADVEDFEEGIADRNKTLTQKVLDRVNLKEKEEEDKYNAGY